MGHDRRYGMKCWNCGGVVSWKQDVDGMPFSGMVKIYECLNCRAFITYEIPNDTEETENSNDPQHRLP